MIFFLTFCNKEISAKQFGPFSVCSPGWPGSGNFCNR